MVFLKFFVIFTFTVWLGLYIFSIFHNKHTQKTTQEFIAHIAHLKPAIFQNVKLRYWTSNGSKHYVYPNSDCDIYLFEHSLAIIRRQKFVFKILYSPIILAHDVKAVKNTFHYLILYKPDRIFFRKTVKGEIDIKLTDPKYKHYKIDITLKGLTTEQVSQLEKIKNWC